MQVLYCRVMTATYVEIQASVCMRTAVYGGHVEFVYVPYVML